MSKEQWRAVTWFAVGAGVGSYAIREIAETRAAKITAGDVEAAAFLDSVILDESEKATAATLVLAAFVATTAYLMSPE